MTTKTTKNSKKNTKKTDPCAGMTTIKGHFGRVVPIITAFGYEGILEVYGSDQVFSGPIPSAYYGLMMANAKKEEKKSLKDELRQQSFKLFDSKEEFLRERQTQWNASHEISITVGDTTLTGSLHAVKVESGGEKVTVGVLVDEDGTVFERDEDNLLEYEGMSSFKSYVEDNILFYTHDAVEAHNLIEEKKKNNALSEALSSAL